MLWRDQGIECACRGRFKECIFEIKSWKSKRKVQREWGFLNLKLRLAGPSASLALEDVSFVSPYLR